MIPSVVRPLCVLAVVLIAATASAQVVNPATAQQKPDPPKDSGRLRTWEMPPITLEGKAPLFEEDLIGDYGQPRWTAHRRFGETRVYVIPAGMVEFEYWLRPTIGKDGAPTKIRSLYEVEFGLPGRFQLDLCAVGNKEGKDGSFAIDSQKVELRYALADWGKSGATRRSTPNGRRKAAAMISPRASSCWAATSRPAGTGAATSCGRSRSAA